MNGTVDGTQGRLGDRGHACCAPAATRTTEAASAPVHTPAQSGQRTSPVEDFDFVTVGGTFDMGDPFGDGHPGDGEGPRHRVSLSDFEIATTSVTNDDFAAFVDATGFVTTAERLGT